MADNVEKTKIVVEAETKGFRTARQEIERLQKEIGELEKKNEQAKRDLSSGKVSNRGKHFKKQHIESRKAKIKQMKKDIKAQEKREREHLKNLDKTETLLIKKMLDDEANIQKRANDRIARAKKAFKLAPTHGNKSLTPDLSPAMKLRSEEIEKQLKTFKLAPTHGDKSLTPKLSSAMQARVDEVNKQLKSFKLAPTHGKKMLSPEISDDLKAQQLASEKKIADKKAEEAKLAEESARIESNYVKAKKRMSKYAKRGYKGMSKHEKAGIKTHNNTVDEMNKAWGKTKGGMGKFVSGIEGIGNASMMAIGQLTMLGGAIFMFGMMGSMVAQKVMAIGDSFAKVENDFLAGAGFRRSVFLSKGEQGRKDFDEIVKQEMAFSGRSTYASGAFLGRGANEFKNMGGVVNKSSLQNLVTASHGASALTGKDSEASMQTILDIAKEGDGSKLNKIGLQELKLTKDMTENIAIIAKAIESDPVASTILKRGTVAGAMQRIRSAPEELKGNIMKKYQHTINSTFQGLSDNIFSVFGNDRTMEQFASVFRNFQLTVQHYFTEERIQKVADGLARWSAEMVNIGAWILEGVSWAIDNPEKVITAFKWAGYIIGAMTTLKVAKGMKDTFMGIYDMFSGTRKMYRLFMDLDIPKTGVLGIVAGVQKMFAVIGGIAKAVGTFMLTNPWILAIAGIGAIGYAIYNHQKNKKGTVAQVETPSDDPSMRSFHNRRDAMLPSLGVESGFLSNGISSPIVDGMPFEREYLRLGSALGNTIDPVKREPFNYYNNATQKTVVGKKERFGLDYGNMQQIIVTGNVNLTQGLVSSEQNVQDSTYE